MSISKTSSESKNLLFKFVPALLLSGMAILLCFSITGCAKTATDTVSDAVPATDSPTSNTSNIDSTGITSGNAEGSALTGANAEDLIENTSFTKVVTVNFGNTVSISNPFSSGEVTINQDGKDVIITATAEHVAYELSGTATEGSVKIYSSAKFKLLLNGISLTNSDGPAVNIQSPAKAFVVVADNTSNTLTDGNSYLAAGADSKGTLYSKGPMIFSGNGSLSLKGNYKHAICSDDYIRVRNGNISVSAAAADGFHTINAFIADGGTINVNAGNDGINCESGFAIVNNGALNLNTANNGITTSYSGTDKTVNPYLNVNGGTVVIKSADGAGLVSKGVLTINKGTISTFSTKEGLTASSAIYINGGSTSAFSTANNGLYTNSTLTITGGKVISVGARSPQAGFYCAARTFKITGGMLLGLGGATSSPTAAVSNVRSVILGSGMMKNLIHIESADGIEALTFLVPVSYSTMLFASPKLKANTSYNLYNGGSVTNPTSFYGVYTSGIYNKGIKYATFTTSNTITQIGGTIIK